MENYKRLVEKLLGEYPLEEWWPTFSECEEERIFEMMIGLILTRQTNWTKAKKAVKGMKDLGLINPERIVEAGESFFREFFNRYGIGLQNQKAKYVVNLSRSLVDNYKGSSLKLGVVNSVDELKERLKELPGIGEEGTEYLILYAYDIPYLPSDRTVKRVLERVSGKSFEEARRDVEEEFGNLTESYKMLHGCLFELGKDSCRITPRCEKCKIKEECEYAKKTG